MARPAVGMYSAKKRNAGLQMTGGGVQSRFAKEVQAVCRARFMRSETVSFGNRASQLDRHRQNPFQAMPLVLATYLKLAIGLPDSNSTSSANI